MMGLVATVGAQSSIWHEAQTFPGGTHWSNGKATVKSCDESRVPPFAVKQNRFNSSL